MTSGRRWLRATATGFVLEFSDGSVTASPPVASIRVVSANGLAVQVDGSASFSTTSQITGYSWSFGDGTSATTPVASHTYTTAGTYTIRLSVTDAVGGTASTTATVAVATTAGNVPPVAAFTLAATDLTVSVDSAGSVDVDGTIAAYRWSFGNGGTASGPTASFTYTAAGTYTVGLTVTDNLGASSSATQQVTVAQGSSTGSGGGGAYAWDHIVYVWFENHSTSQIYGNTSAPYINQIAAQNAKFTGFHGTNHPSWPNYVAGFFGSTFNDVYQGVSTPTHISGSNMYTALQGVGKTFNAYTEEPETDTDHNPWNFADGTGTKPSGPTVLGTGCERTFQLAWTPRIASGDYGSLPNATWVVPFDYHSMDNLTTGTVAGSDAWLKANFDGYINWAKTHNSLFVLVFDEGSDFTNKAQPCPMVIAGAGVKAGTYANNLDHIDVARMILDTFNAPFIGTTGSRPQLTAPFTTGGGPTPAPTATFTIAPTGLTVAVDATASTSATGTTITSYAWNFGDGATATGKIPTAHTYAAAGTYTVTLSIVDSAGGKATATHTVTLTAPTSNQPPVAAFTVSGAATGTVTFNGSGSTDSDGRIVLYAWDFGDTKSGSGPTVSHPYTSSGSYTTKLTVTDDKGATNTLSKTVAVTVPSTGGGGVPQYDHIVYLWLENESYTNIMGSSSVTPYVKSVGLANALFTNAHGVAHPSEPNYVAAFSGSTYSITDDLNHDLGAQPNIFAQMAAKSMVMKGYAEPTVVRKHAPWQSFSNTTGCEVAFSTFPTTNFASLPRMSWIIPNLTDDMHDGPLSVGDTWVKNHLDGLIQWAKNPANKTLVVITFDEDGGVGGSTSGNQIPLIFVGAYVVPGTYTGHVDHYDVLGMFEDSLGLSRIGNAVGRAALTAPFAGPVTQPNQPPVAAFSTAVSGLTVGFNGGLSTDSSGTINSYVWDFGDGVAASGVSVSHTYAVAKGYTVTLTVKDTNNLSGTTTQTVLPQGGSGNWTLNWADEFTATAVDSTVWGIDNNTSFGSGNNELEVQLASAVTIGSSNLTVTARKLTTPITLGGKTYNYSSGHLSSIGKKTFLIGPNNPIRVEVRAQMPDVTHLLPAPLWLRPADGGMGEVDLCEATGTTSTDNPLNQRLSQSVHTLTYSPDVFHAAVTNLTSANGVMDWHIYATEITSTATRFYVDGVLKATIDATSLQNGSTTATLGATYGQIFGTDRPWFFHITLGVGGNWPGTPDASTIFPAAMNIDYVRVYR